PLSNHRALRVSSLADENPRGFGLLQRDRDFNHYLDMEADYELRPSLWVIPQGEWGKGRVELVEIPTDTEVNDNIVAYWVPDQPFKAGESRHYSYRLRTFDQHLAEQGGARVLRTRIGWGAVPGQSNPPPRSKRQFIVDFNGGELENLSANIPLEADLEKNSGTITDLMVMRLPDQKTWRVSFKLEPEGNNLVDMRLSIKLRGQRLSEGCRHVWYPDAVQETSWRVRAACRSSSAAGKCYPAALGLDAPLGFYAAGHCHHRNRCGHHVQYSRRQQHYHAGGGAAVFVFDHLWLDHHR